MQEPGQKRPVGDIPPDKGSDAPVGDEERDNDIPPTGDVPPPEHNDIPPIGDIPPSGGNTRTIE